MYMHSLVYHSHHCIVKEYFNNWTVETKNGFVFHWGNNHRLPQPVNPSRHVLIFLAHRVACLWILDKNCIHFLFSTCVPPTLLSYTDNTASNCWKITCLGPNISLGEQFQNKWKKLLWKTRNKSSVCVWLCSSPVRQQEIPLLHNVRFLPWFPTLER